jgi:hypothetical protein
MTRRWKPSLASPWMTRAEAADYLRWHVRTVDKALVTMQKERVSGKMRYHVQETGSVKHIRILAADVYAISPLPSSHDPSRFCQT